MKSWENHADTYSVVVWIFTSAGKRTNMTQSQRTVSSGFELELIIWEYNASRGANGLLETFMTGRCKTVLKSSWGRAELPPMKRMAVATYINCPDALSIRVCLRFSEGHEWGR